MISLLGSEAIDIAEYEMFLQHHPKGHFMQSYDWGNVKDQWEFHALIARDETQEIRGTLAILIRPLGFLGLKIAYSPRGPVCEMGDEAMLYELLSAAAAFVREKRCCCFTIDPDVGSECIALLQAAARAGYEAPRKTTNFESIQARFVMRLDLVKKNGQDVLSGFESKTRYNLKKSAKEGVRVTNADASELPVFFRLMQATGKRDGFMIRPLAYFVHLMDCMKDHTRLYLAYVGDTPVAGAIALQYGDKMWYLYGASDNVHRNCMPNYAVQWEIIQWALEQNCRLYDFRGVPGDDDPQNPIHGLYRFKKGFGSIRTEFIGELTYKNGMCKNALFSFALRLRKKMMKLKAKL